MTKGSDLTDTTGAECLTENELFSTGAAKKLTVIGQQSEPPSCVEKNGPFGSRSFESFLSGQWSADSAGSSIVWQ